MIYRNKKLCRTKSKSPEDSQSNLNRPGSTRITNPDVTYSFLSKPTYNMNFTPSIDNNEEKIFQNTIQFNDQTLNSSMHHHEKFDSKLFGLDSTINQDIPVFSPVKEFKFESKEVDITKSESYEIYKLHREDKKMRAEKLEE